MSIRLRLTLLYSTILALTLLIFGAALYTIQAQTTMNALKQDLSGRSDTFVQSFLRAVLNPFDPRLQPPLLDWLSGDQAFRSLREREIIRVLDRSGALLASPMGGEQRALPLSAQGMEVLQSGRSVWETGKQDGTDLLIYNRPVLANNEVVLVIQVAHPLTERNRSLAALRRTLIATGAAHYPGSLRYWLASGGVQPAPHPPHHADGRDYRERERLHPPGGLPRPER
jgi:two-component system, OmpR family, sensor kinase